MGCLQYPIELSIGREAKAMRSPFERRNFIRLPKKFQVNVKIPRTGAEIDGVTENLSQGGALISSKSLPAFQRNDEAIVEFFVSPEMTGQRHILILKGMVVIKRIEKERQGIAVEFHKKLSSFEVSR
jgi:c-di-GMP-binding flagellar brake protein YcgR